jgi:hypothetical protein
MSATPTARSGAPTPAPYPLRLRATLDPDLSRWKWLVKWVLVLPHIVVLMALWVMFVVLTIAAGVAILFTGRYPRGIFDLNVGVLRWTWRVSYYAYGGLGTDRYPPFSFEAEAYPAELEIDPPGPLSRGLVLVKWWLLALPHLLIVGVLTGGGLAWTWEAGPDGTWRLSLAGGLIGLLVLVAGVALLFTGRYPPRLFDLVIGFQRWAYRVAAYVALMTDVYPPFRLDQGGEEPPVGAPPAPPAPSGAAGTSGTAGTSDAPGREPAVH